MRDDAAGDGAFPAEAMDVKVSDAGGEVSMSLEETNRVREKLGLKPLRDGESDRAKRRREEEERAHAERSEAARAKETAEISAKIAAAKERRLMDARNRATKQLGDADEDEDDLGAWVNKSRTIEAKRREAERAKAEALARKLAEQDDDAEEESEDEDGGGGGDAAYSSKELAGLKVRHGADEVNEGETMILTLKDSSILDEKRGALNEEEDELENVLAAENKRREKARKAASKKPGSSNPFGADDEAGEDAATVLGKYDDAKEDEGLTLDDRGAVTAAEERRKAEIRRRLAATLGGAPAGAAEESAATTKRNLADFMTADEAAAEKEKAGGFKKKKKRRKKLREKALDPSELEGDELAPGASELGKRRGAESVAPASLPRDADRAAKDAKFAAALNKAKLKTDEKISAEMAGEAGPGVRTTRATRTTSPRAPAEPPRRAKAPRAPTPPRRARGVRRCAPREGRGRVRVRARVDVGVAFTDAEGFPAATATTARGRRLQRQRVRAGAARRRVKAFRSRTLCCDGDGEDAGRGRPLTTTISSAAASAAPPPGGYDDDGSRRGRGGGLPRRAGDLGGVGEGSVASKGLAATLALLKNTGKLGETEMWDGRTNDKKPLALMRAKEAAAVPSGEFEGKTFDFHLDKFDEFGRKMTPKEAFRDLCHKFHGIEPGKAKKEKRLRMYQEEVKAKKMSEEKSKLGAAEKMKLAQAMQSSPFLVLSGKVHAGQSSDATSAFAIANEAKKTGKVAPSGAESSQVRASALNSASRQSGEKVQFAVGRKK